MKNRWAGGRRLITNAVMEAVDRRVLLSVGAIDPTFGANGSVAYPFTINDTKAHAVAVQNDGKIVELLGINSQGMAIRRFNTNGTIDKTFGNNGTAIASAGSSSTDVGAAILVQSDGKIVVAGKSNNMFLLVRLTSSGKLDTSFNGTGRTSVFTLHANPTSLIQQSDGKLVVAGEADNEFAMARFTTSGKLDKTFGSYGTVNTTFSGTNNDAIEDIALQSDGKIVALGTITSTAGPATLTVARYTTSGALDKTFNKTGIFKLFAGSGGTQVAIQSGKIIIAGWGNSETFFERLTTSGTVDKTFGTGGISNITAEEVNAVTGIAIDASNRIVFDTQIADGQVGIGRLTSNGAADSTFGSGGFVTTHFYSESPLTFPDTPTSLALQSDGKIVIAGYGTIATLEVFNQAVLARFTTSGAPDATFGSGGHVTDIPSGSIGQYNDVAVQSDGKIVAVGTTIADASGTHDFLIDRYNTDGTLDFTFGNGGRLFIDFGGDDHADSVTIAGGKIIISGVSENPWASPASYSIAIVSLNESDGSLDTTFNKTGMLLKPIATDLLTSAVNTLQPDGSILIGATLDGSSSAEAGEVMRFTPAGAFDTSFGNQGIATINYNLVSYPSGSARALLVQPDGKILVAGETAAPPIPPNYFEVPFDFAVTRLNSDGSFDSSFGNAGQAVFPVDGYIPQVEGAVLLSNGQIVLAGSGGPGDYNGIALLVTPTGQELNSYITGHAVHGVALAPNGQILLSIFDNNGSEGSGVLLNPDFSPATTFEATAGAVAVEPDGDFIFAGSESPISEDALSNPLIQRYLGVNSNPPFAQIISGNELFVTGTDGNDAISIDPVSSNIVVTLNGQKLSFPASSIKSIYVTAVGGNDVVHNNTSLPSTILGGDGSDALFGGSGADALHGDAGNDYLSGLAGNDTMNGGDGNDDLDGGTGADLFIGGDGNDTADYHFRTDNLTLFIEFDGGAQGASGATGKNEGDDISPDIETILGGSGNDYIYAGTTGSVNLQGNFGNDTLIGGSGNDTLTGGPGHDQLNGNQGNDLLLAQDGQTDTLDGGDGNNTASIDNSNTVKDQVTNVQTFI